MSKKHDPAAVPEPEETIQQPEETTAPETEAQTAQPEAPEVQPAAPEAEAQSPADDKFLRLAAEYDNYRKRTAKEKEALWSEVKAQTALAFLPVYDNLERALKQPTADTAYKKGVEMTMEQLRGVLDTLGIKEIAAQGELFDPNVHNAVMHIEDESFGENTVCEVFQTGFILGERVIRHATVKVAN